MEGLQESVQRHCEEEVKSSAGRCQHWSWYVGLYQPFIGFGPMQMLPVEMEPV